jgi:hypothetical protein
VVSRIHPSENEFCSSESAPPWIRTLPESRSVAANARRGDGGDAFETDIMVHGALALVVSNDHTVVNGINELCEGE